MEQSNLVTCDFPSLYQFKGQPWSSLITCFKESNRSKSREDYSVTNHRKQEIDIDIEKKREIDMEDLNQFKGQPWSAIIDTLDMNALLGSPEKINNDCRVTRLPRKDMNLFGICPLYDKFCAAVCSICGAVVKFQGLERHMQIKHSSDSETALLPPPQVPVKKTKTVNLKVKHKDPAVTSATIHSSESIVPSLQPIVSSVKHLDTSLNTSSTITASAASSKTYMSKVNNSSVLQLYNSESTPNHVPRRKSPNTSSSDRKAQKSRDKDHEHSKHQSVGNDEVKQSHSCRPPSSKTHSSTTPRRAIISRTKDFNKLVAEHRATKDSQANSLLTSSKCRAQSILRNVAIPSAAPDAEIAAAGVTLQSSLPVILDSVPDTVTSPAPSSLSPSHTASTTTTNTSMNVEYLDLCNSMYEEVASSCGPNTGMNISMDIDVMIPDTSTAVTSVSHGASRNSVTNVHSTLPSFIVHTTSISNSVSTAPAATTTSGNQTQVLHVTPFTSSHVYTYKSPVIILNPKESSAAPVCVPSVNLNVNTESVSSANMVPMLNMTSAPTSPKPVVVSREVIESLNVPVVVDVPVLPESLTNITVYTSYPKPLVVSTFSAKKVGNHVVFSSSNRRLEFIRSKFKSVLNKSKRVNTNGSISLKNVQSAGGAAGDVVVSTLGGAKPTALNANTGTATATCRFPKSTSSVSNIQQATSLLAHRPNILRTAAPRPHLPKILSAGLKRPAPSSQQQLAAIDCKHMLLKPAASNINVSGIIGKMIVHQHEVADVGEGPAPNHLALDKVVPVNIK